MPLRSLWQLDYRELGDEWDVVCPGPSLDQTRCEAYGRPTIEVNLALGLAQGRATSSPAFWCSWDQPTRGIHDVALERRPNRPLVVLTSGPTRSLWYDWLREHAGEREPLVVGPAREDPDPEAWHGLGAGPSWLLATRFAVQRGGARTIRYFGLDLEGEGYAAGVVDPASRSPETWAGRWVGERLIRRRLFGLLDEVGVRVVEVSA